MQLVPKAAAMAFAIVSGVVSFLCVALIALFPSQTMNVFGWLIHINNLADLLGPRNINLLNGVVGIVVFSAIAYVIGWFFAVLYNKFAGK